MKFFKKERKIIYNEPFLLISLPIAFFILIITFILRPFLLIRFGLIHSDRIGHFATNTELALCEKKFFKIKSLDLFYFPTEPCNKFFAKIVKQKVLVLPKIILRPFCLIVRKIKYLKIHIAGQPMSGDYDVNNLIDKYRNQLNITKTDISQGNKFMNKINPKNKPVVTLIIRDSKYLKNLVKNNSFNYHSHRNDNINKYKRVVSFLIQKGYFVIRMGNVAKDRLKIKNNNFLDYPFYKEKSDFLDIFIGFKCEICITNGTGYDAIPTIFRRKMINIDPIPIGYISTYSKRHFSNVTKHYSIKLNKYLSLSEIFKFSLDNKFEAKEFNEEKIKLVKSSSTEIEKIVDDALNYFNNIKYRNKFSKKFKKKYKENLLRYKKNNSFRYHGKLKSEFSKYWLKKYKYLLN